MLDPNLKCAVIYCRVSSTAQTKRGDGLSLQKTRCNEYARARGYQVVQTFSDDASGSLTKRPGMTDMLDYLKAHRRAGLIVLIDDISRLARGVKAHIELRAAITLAGGTLESPSVEFGEDADSELQSTSLRRWPSTSAARTQSRPRTGCARGS